MGGGNVAETSRTCTHPSLTEIAVFRPLPLETASFTELLRQNFVYTRHDTTRHDTTRQTRHDTTRHDTTRHDTTRHDTTRHDTTRHDTRVRIWSFSSERIKKHPSRRIEPRARKNRAKGAESSIRRLRGLFLSFLPGGHLGPRSPCTSGVRRCAHFDAGA
jgi:hypothetical protein